MAKRQKDTPPHEIETAEEEAVEAAPIPREAGIVQTPGETPSPSFEIRKDGAIAHFTSESAVADPIRELGI